jgi:LemA protein
MNVGIVVGAALLVVVVVLGAWTIWAYNRLVRLRNLVQESWRQIDVELRRRHDLIPNLVESVRGYAAHESGVLADVTAARAAADSPAAGPAAAAAQETVLTQALGRLFAVAEAYPALRATESFQMLQEELANTEDRVAAGRRFYNANVRELNTGVETFPQSLVASAFSFTRAEYFELDTAAERTLPRVDFRA